MLTPSPLRQLFEPFRAVPGSMLLESNSSSVTSPTSFFAINPFQVVFAYGEAVTVISARGQWVLNGNSLDILERLLMEHSIQSDYFFGPGALGFFSYELGYALQNLPQLPKDDLGLPDYWFAFYDEIVCSQNKNAEPVRIGKVKYPPIPPEKLSASTPPTAHW